MENPLTSDEVIAKIAEALKHSNGYVIEAVANQVGISPKVCYVGDSTFEVIVGD
jgi:hypothetical protein